MTGPDAEFKARPPWWGGDLQTVRNVVVRTGARLDGFPSERWRIPIEDGSGDVLLANFLRPRPGDEDPSRAVVLLIHGLTGCEDSLYILNSARFLLSRGHPVVRVNLRGAGPSLELCREYYHAGRTADFAVLMRDLRTRLEGRAMAAVGYSLGGNMLLKYLGEEGADAGLSAAASISAPIDLAAAARAFLKPRNALYQRWLMGFLRHDALNAREALPPDLERAVKTARTVYAFDDSFVAPRYGFAGADDYYARSMALPYLPAIETPTLIIHARNDPWIPMDGYAAFDWDAHPRLHPLLPRGGGHVGFHDARSNIAWHDRAIARFLDEMAAAPLSRPAGTPSRRSHRA